MIKGLWCTEEKMRTELKYSKTLAYIIIAQARRARVSAFPIASQDLDCQNCGLLSEVPFESGQATIAYSVQVLFLECSAAPEDPSSMTSQFQNTLWRRKRRKPYGPLR